MSGEMVPKSMTDSDVPTYYSNSAAILVGASDVAVTFGNEFPGIAVSPDVRIVFSHDQFIRMMDFFYQRVHFLRGVMGEPRNLDDMASADPEKFDKLLKQYLIKNEQGEDQGATNTQ